MFSGLTLASDPVCPFPQRMLKQKTRNAMHKEKKERAIR